MGTLYADNVADRATLVTVDMEYVTQGVAKCFARVNSAGDGTEGDPLNVSSITDSGTGDRIVVYTNGISTNHCVQATPSTSSPTDRTAGGARNSTTGGYLNIYDISVTGGVDTQAQFTAYGDLA